jgi:hypothetical protein
VESDFQWWNGKCDSPLDRCGTGNDENKLCKKHTTWMTRRSCCRNKAISQTSCLHSLFRSITKTFHLCFLLVEWALRCFIWSSEKRFLSPLVSLCFDYPYGSAQRWESDPFASVTEIMNLLICSSQRCYSLWTNMCVDEVLISFRGLCQLRKYTGIQNKSAKYILK